MAKRSSALWDYVTNRLTVTICSSLCHFQSQQKNAVVGDFTSAFLLTHVARHTSPAAVNALVSFRCGSCHGPVVDEMFYKDKTGSPHRKHGLTGN